MWLKNHVRLSIAFESQPLGLQPDFIRELCIRALYTNPLFSSEDTYDRPYLEKQAIAYSIFHDKKIDAFGTASEDILPNVINHMGSLVPGTWIMFLFFIVEDWLQ